MGRLAGFWTLHWWHLINIYYFLAGNPYISSSETTGVTLLLKKIGASCKHSGESSTSWKGWDPRSASSCWIFLSFCSKTSSSWVIFSVWRETCVDNSIIRLIFRSPSSTGGRPPLDSSRELSSRAKKKKKVWAVLIGFPRAQREGRWKSCISHVPKREHRCCVIWSDILRMESGSGEGKVSGCSWKKNLEASREGGESVFANSFL